MDLSHEKEVPIDATTDARPCSRGSSPPCAVARLERSSVSRCHGWARNGRDWHHLIDLCALVGTLVVDPAGVYDTRHHPVHPHAGRPAGALTLITEERANHRRQCEMRPSISPCTRTPSITATSDAGVPGRS
jgi:hypothetical protein